MKILILEDDNKKKDCVVALISKIDSSITVESVNNFSDYLKKITAYTYDLLIVDLVVLNFANDTDTKDMTQQITDVTRDYKCPNYRTPAIALTGFDNKAEENFKDLNLADITVVTFIENSEQWKTSIQNKVNSCIPPVHYEFVILCALRKEAEAFSAAGYSVGNTKLVGSLSCQEIQIGAKLGVIITAPRMGLVSSAVISTQAIERFKPKLICMSGICGGIEGKSNIYDIVIPEICHQHDAGKWTENGFESEMYSVQLDHNLRSRIDAVITHPTFNDLIKKDVTLQKDEFPEGQNSLTFNIVLAPASSGSAVVADKAQVDLIKNPQRKLSAFEMETFAVYESARLSASKPQYFSAKAVVDNGVVKGDAFHRVACILSAKVVYECINSGLLDN